MKRQVLFSLKNNEKIFMNVICCSHDWPFKGEGGGGIFVLTSLLLQPFLCSGKATLVILFMPPLALWFCLWMAEGGIWGGGGGTVGLS